MKLFVLTLLLFCAQSFAATTYQQPLNCTATAIALNSPSTTATVTCPDVPTPPPVYTSFPAYVNPAGGYFSHWAGKYQLNFCNGGCTSPGTIDVSKFDEIFQKWPGQAGLVAYMQLRVNNYFSAQFTPQNLKAGQYDAFKSGETNNQALYSMTISTTGGDFSNPSLPGSTVVPGCYKNKVMTETPLQWNALAGNCALQNGVTYYINFVNADISHVLPGGKGYMTSTKTDTCKAGTYCVLPIYNGPRNF